MDAPTKYTLKHYSHMNFSSQLKTLRSVLGLFGLALLSMVVLIGCASKETQTVEDKSSGENEAIAITAADEQETGPLSETRTSSETLANSGTQASSETPIVSEAQA